EVLAELAVGRTWSGFCYETHTLLQRNVLAGILRGFGRFGLPVPPGDAISRIRDEPPSITMGSMDGMADLVGRGLFAIIGGAVMLLGAGRIRSGSFTIGDFALFVVFLDQLTYLPAEIGRVITETKRTRVSIDRLNALMPGESRDTVVAPAPIYVRSPLPPATP